MTLRHWLAVSAAITFPFGIASLLAPGVVASTFGNAMDADAALWANYYGAAVLCLAVIAWYGRSLRDDVLQRRLALLLSLFYTINLAVSARAQAAGVVNEFGWINILLELLLAIAFGYFALRRPNTGDSTAGRA